MIAKKPSGKDGLKNKLSYFFFEFSHAVTKLRIAIRTLTAIDTISDVSILRLVAAVQLNKETYQKSIVAPIDFFLCPATFKQVGFFTNF